MLLQAGAFSTCVSPPLVPLSRVTLVRTKPFALASFPTRTQAPLILYGGKTTCKLFNLVLSDINRGREMQCVAPPCEEVSVILTYANHLIGCP